MNNIIKTKSLLKQINEILDNIPEKNDISDIINNLNELINYLQKVQQILINMPTNEEAQKAKKAIKKLNDILNRNPLIKEILIGKRIKKEKKKIDKLETEQDQENSLYQEKINQYIEELSKLTESEIRNYLEIDNKIFTNKVLISILSKLGRSVAKKTSKKELIDIIVTTIINNRTYEGLRKSDSD